MMCTLSSAGFAFCIFPEERFICKAFGLSVTRLGFISTESYIFFNFRMLVNIGNSISFLLGSKMKTISSQKTLKQPP